jgi:hypothetical protein
MGQLNLNLKPEFEEQLRAFMQLRGISNKSEAVRIAIREGLEAARRSAAGPLDFRKWIGLGRRAPLNPRPRFRSDDELWSK